MALNLSDDFLAAQIGAPVPMPKPMPFMLRIARPTQQWAFFIAQLDLKPYQIFQPRLDIVCWSGDEASTYLRLAREAGLLARYESPEFYGIPNAKWLVYEPTPFEQAARNFGFITSYGAIPFVDHSSAEAGKRRMASLGFPEAMLWINTHPGMSDYNYALTEAIKEENE